METPMCFFFSPKLLKCKAPVGLDGVGNPASRAISQAALKTTEDMPVIFQRGNVCSLVADTPFPLRGVVSYSPKGSAEVLEAMEREN